MNNDLDVNLEDILDSDDAFSDVPTDPVLSLGSTYFRNKISSNGGLLSQEERSAVEEIF